MKKLYENIENIHIKGDISQLTDMVTTIDRSMQYIAEASEQLLEYLSRYSATNKGQQYEKVVNTALALRDRLYDASVDLNRMQNEIAAYQNKIYRYEGLNLSAQKPNPLRVSKDRRINADTSSVQFNRSDMINVAAILKKYSEQVNQHLRQINEKKNSIGNIWMDSQYRDFAAYIDGINNNIRVGISAYQEYYLYLQVKIKELS